MEETRFPGSSGLRRQPMGGGNNEGFVADLQEGFWSLWRLGWKWRIAWARFMGANIGQNCRIGRGAEVTPGPGLARSGEVSLGPWVEISAGCLLHPHGGFIRVGENVHVGPGTIIYGHGGVEIGEHTLLAMHCRVLSSSHTIPPPGVTIRSQPDILQPTSIGRDVWLGAGVTVLGGVTIGEGCVVGAGAVVTKDLPPWSIAVGVPARVTGRREPVATSAVKKIPPASRR